MDFKTWLNEITADYGDLVPGWRGDPEGPFEDPKRMQSDPKFWRDYHYKKEKAAKDLEKAEKEHETDPSRANKKKLGQAMGASLWSAMPTIPDSKPRGEYQGYSSWDTWVVLLWANNERDTVEKFRKYARMKDPEKWFKRYVKRHKKVVDEFGAYKVDLDYVDWDEVLEDFSKE